MQFYVGDNRIKAAVDSKRKYSQKNYKRQVLTCNFAKSILNKRLNNWINEQEK